MGWEGLLKSEVGGRVSVEFSAWNGLLQGEEKVCVNLSIKSTGQGVKEENKT